MDEIFKALADASRRGLLDELHRRGGQTLGELCRPLAMTRQAVAKHLAILETANLISTIWQGREKLHYLNPVPLHGIQERWISKYELSRLQALSNLKQSLEATTNPNYKLMNPPAFVYTTYIRSSAEKTWEAITQPEFARQYWGGMSNVSDWNVGSGWKHVTESNESWVTGTVLESLPPERLVLTWADPDDLSDVSHVTYEIEAIGEMVRLTVTHDHFKPGSDMAGKVSKGWPHVLSSLKSFLETGTGLKVGCGS